MVGGSTHGWSRSPWEAVTSVSGVEPADAIGQQAGSMSDVGRVKISWTLPAIMRHNFTAFKASRLSQRRRNIV